MKLKPIKTKKEYKIAMARLEEIFDAKQSTSEGDELEVLGILIEKYENEHFPIGLPDPVEAIKFRLEQMDYSQTDFANIIGLKSRSSEILNRKRKLTLPMIRVIHKKLQIPTDILVQEY